MADVELIQSLFRYYPDWPKPGVRFCDIFPVFQNPQAFEALITHFLAHVFSEVVPRLPAAADGSKKIDAVVGLDARGFLLGPILALRLGAAFVPVRKRGKLPGEVQAAVYAKEYGEVCASFSPTLVCLSFSFIPSSVTCFLSSRLFSFLGQLVLGGRKGTNASLLCSAMGRPPPPLRFLCVCVCVSPRRLFTSHRAMFAREKDVFEMQTGALSPGARVLVVDDLIATGGSAKAAGELVHKSGAITASYLFVVAIPFLKGAEALDAPVYAYVLALLFFDFFFSVDLSCSCSYILRWLARPAERRRRVPFC